MHSLRDLDEANPYPSTNLEDCGNVLNQIDNQTMDIHLFKLFENWHILKAATYYILNGQLTIYSWMSYLSYCIVCATQEVTFHKTWSSTLYNIMFILSYSYLSSYWIKLHLHYPYTLYFKEIKNHFALNRCWGLFEYDSCGYDFDRGVRVLGQSLLASNRCSQQKLKTCFHCQQSRSNNTGRHFWLVRSTSHLADGYMDLDITQHQKTCNNETEIKTTLSIVYCISIVCLK